MSALFLASMIGETLQAAPVSALNEFAWHAKWFQKTTPVCGLRSGGYGMVSFGHPDPKVVDGTVSPKYFGLALFRKVSGARVLNASSSAAAVRAYASEFSTGEVGVVLVNTAAAAAATVHLRLDAGLRGAAGAMLNGWVLSAAPGDPAPSRLDAPTVAVNGQGNGLPWGGPWPLGAVKPYTRGSATAPLAVDALSVDVPAASVTALVIHPHGVSPSPPPSPPASPPPAHLWRCTGQGVHHTCHLYPQPTTGYDTKEECEASSSCGPTSVESA